MLQGRHDTKSTDSNMQRKLGSGFRSIWHAGERPSEVRVFVGVLSRANNSEGRQTIRSTWGSDKNIAKLMFFTMRPHSDAAFLALRQEAVASGDIFITSDVYEDYYNITYAVLDIFRAAAVYGPHEISHVIKTDDDSYMRSNLVVRALQSLPRSWLFAGYPMKCGKANRQEGLRYVPYSNWKREDRVRYGFGAGYALSMDLAMEIALGAAHTVMPADNLLMIEDLSVGYWVHHVGKEKGVRINYKRNLTIELECAPDVMFFHIKNADTQRMMKCMHQRGGGCCPHLENTLNATNRTL